MTTTVAQPAPPPSVDRSRVVASTIDSLDVDAFVDRILARRSVVGLAVSVIRDGQPASFHGRGVADVRSRATITEDTVFRIASITKTFTAIAVMQLWEQGLVELDAPADEYLSSYRLVPARSAHRPVTLRHLLTHTSGLGELAHPSGLWRPDFGESVPAGEPLPSLATFYGGGLHLAAEPGSRFVYGNQAPATLGQIVEDVTGTRLDRYFREHIFDVLGMSDTDLLRSAHVASRLATGYELASRGPRQVAERDMVTAGAASIYSSSRDMARYVAALLGGGTNEHGSVLEPASMAAMFEPHYRPDPRIPGMGLGFFRVELDAHAGVEHMGVHPGFHSHLIVAPADGVGVIAFTNGAWQPMYWLGAEARALLRQQVGLPEERVRHDVARRPETWADVTGWYRLDAGLTDVRLRVMLGAGIEVNVRDGELVLRFLTPMPALSRGFRLWPDDPSDPYAYRIDLEDMGTTRVVFSGQPGTRDRSVHLGFMPLSLDRQSDATNPRVWGRRGLGAVGALALAGAAIAVGRRSGVGQGGSRTTTS